jgi:hexokinase
MFFQFNYGVVISQGLKVEVVALVNDTVGTLMACSSIYRDCKAGVILGTGNENRGFDRCLRLSRLY